MINRLTSLNASPYTEYSAAPGLPVLDGSFAKFSSGTSGNPGTSGSDAGIDGFSGSPLSSNPGTAAEDIITSEIQQELDYIMAQLMQPQP